MDIHETLFGKPNTAEISVFIDSEDGFDKTELRRLWRLKVSDADFFANSPEVHQGHGDIRHYMKGSHVISGIDSKNKKTERLRNCTGIVVVGVDRKTKKTVSFITHQNPEEVLVGKALSTSFAGDLEETLREFDKRTLPEGRDAIFFGGWSGAEWTSLRKKPEGRKVSDDYPDKYFLIKELVEQKTGTSLREVSAPKKVFSNDNAFFENRDRKFSLVRPARGSRPSEAMWDDGGRVASKGA